MERDQKLADLKARLEEANPNWDVIRIIGDLYEEEFANPELAYAYHWMARAKKFPNHAVIDDHWETWGWTDDDMFRTDPEDLHAFVFRNLPDIGTVYGGGSYARRREYRSMDDAANALAVALVTTKV